MKIGVLASHAGTTLQAVLDAVNQGKLSARVVIVISNNGGSGALRRAAAANVPAVHLSSRTHEDANALDSAMRDTLTQSQVDLVLLAGYMKRLGPSTLAAFRGRIVNTHPALLPKFGGQGMYGARVHEAVLAAGETVTGVSIHLVESEYDSGPVIAQAEVPVQADDSAESLAARVQARERALLVEVLDDLATGRRRLP